MKIGKHKYKRTEVDDVHSHNVDLRSREIWLTPNDDIVTGIGEPLYGDPGVEYSMTTRFLKNLHLLMNDNPAPILIHMKTHGGDWNEGIAIYDAIKTCPCYVTIINYTMARSMSSLIFCAADRRVMMPHSWFMFHDGSFGMEGTAKQALTEAEMLKKTSKQMLDIYIEVMGKHSDLWKGKSIKQREKWLRDAMDKKEEVYLSPIEAISHGFADEIFDGDWNSLVDKKPND
jgi:ATP-dependent protease ClpP protease subunit